MKYAPPYGVNDPDAPYVNGDPSIARQGSILPAAAAEYPQREIVNYILDSDLVPTDNDLHQLTRSARSQWVNFCVDSGAVNAMSVALLPALEAYRQGTPLRVLCANNNSGPTTINVNSLGNRPVVRSNGAQLEPDDIRAGQVVLLVDDGTRFQVMNYLGAAGGISNFYQIHIPYAEDVSTTPNIVIANFTPAITAVSAGDIVLVKLKNRNTGAVTIAINGLGAQAVKRNDGQPLQGSDVLADECILIEFNTTYWQMLRLVRSQVWFKLSADLILYVRPTGNDNNDGSLNDDAHAFRTIQAAVNFVRSSFVTAGRTVTIQLGVPGVYQGSVLIQDLPGSIQIRGDSANIGGYTVQGTAESGGQYPRVIVMSGSGTSVSLNGFTVYMRSSRGNMVECNYGANVYISNLAFSGVTVVDGGCIGSFGGTVTVSGYIDVYNTPAGFAGLAIGASLTIGLWFTLINMHGVGMNAFVNCSGSTAYIAYGWCQFAGSAYGYRYLGYYNSSIVVNGGGPYYLPGNIDGAVDASSVYG